MNSTTQHELSDWQELVAIGALAGDLTPSAIARFARVPHEVAALALERSEAEAPDDEGEHLADLVERLPADTASRVHAEVALHLLRQGPDRVEAALEHARASGSSDQHELCSLLLVTGRLALSSGDHSTAAGLLAGAVEFGAGDDPIGRARVLIDLARATDGCGDVDGARSLLLDVVRLASAHGNHDLVVEAVIRSVLPVEWRAGDREASALLDLAEATEGDGPRAAVILAARAMVEMRVPASEEQGHQVAWVTRAKVAQPLAERALAMTEGTSDRDRLLTLGAWRLTHRGPAHLARRLDHSRSALDLAQRHLDHDRLVDAAVGVAVDCMEAGDRSGYDDALAMIRWVAETDGNPRLRWWSSTMSAGAALLDGDIERGASHRSDAVRIGELHEIPGWLSGEILLAAETAVTADDAEALRPYLVPVNTPLATSPVARSMVAWAAARTGEHALAVDHARIACRTIDEETSYLLCLTLLARSAVVLDDRALVEFCEVRLIPYADHLAVDGVGWWCHGPVSLALAELAAARGDVVTGTERLELARSQVVEVGDVRSLQRIERVIARFDGLGDATAIPLDALASLTERETQVLQLIARGRTNSEIAAELAYSVSTIRVDTISIYRKLGVHGRAAAVALAFRAGYSGT